MAPFFTARDRCAWTTPGRQTGSYNGFEKRHTPTIHLNILDDRERCLFAACRRFDVAPAFVLILPSTATSPVAPLLRNRRLRDPFLILLLSAVPNSSLVVA